MVQISRPCLLLAGGIVLMMAAATSAAKADCLCRANGEQYKHGQLVCLKLPQGSQLARCDKVLNNASWKFLGQSCERISGLQSPAPKPPLLQAQNKKGA
ncbi:hypothetical protein NA8A_17520 [Nitratireductor indicus C115]|uniref:Uncharacterized protein n=2 Tax=Nitratireductor indicus TaxID=721133 RepID=K2P0W5_9HYPH|nr:hypothetical protein NA8A_17520 [Nitratireductor indicus C115]SFQ73643.1 hypothetical protein SAMN05216176_11219 [Nitratireductor indicus]